MKFYLFFCFILLINLNIYSQAEDRVVKYELDGIKGSYNTFYGRYGETKSEKALRYFIQGMDLGRAGKYIEARELYLKSIKADKKFLEPYEIIALDYKNEKEYEKAIEYFDKILAVCPDSKMTIRFKEDALRRIEDRERKQAFAINKLKSDPNNPGSYISAALVYMGEEKWEDAIKYAIRGLQLSDPGKATASMAYTIIVKCYLKLGDKETAKEYYLIKTQYGRGRDPELEKELGMGK